jgi:hypothetical protein
VSDHQHVTYHLLHLPVPFDMLAKECKLDVLHRKQIFNELPIAERILELSHPNKNTIN